MTATIRQRAACISVNPATLSVTRDFLGFQGGALDAGVSVLTQMRRLTNQHVHMNIILVGTETYVLADIREVDAAIQFTRDSYDQVNLGVGRILWFNIPTAQSRGREDIANNDEAETLTDEWTVDNDALDIFIVQTYAGTTIGLSRVDGPCNKDAKGMDGSVVAIEDSVNTTGFVLAHEAGHYLGLSHGGGSGNLMFGTVPNGGALTTGQGNNMRDHCFVRAGCALVA
jgi:Metallo-peptidase family M12B Reprolysin-like